MLIFPRDACFFFLMCKNIISLLELQTKIILPKVTSKFDLRKDKINEHLCYLVKIFNVNLIEHSGGKILVLVKKARVWGW